MRRDDDPPDQSPGPAEKKPLSIWVTGRPVSEAERKRGTFADMIRQAVGEAWSGPWQLVDCMSDGPAGSSPLPRPSEVSGIIVTGSASHVAERAPWMLRVQAGLREAVAENVPTLGICFGHQLLGLALGGHSGTNPRGREIGTVPMRLTASDPLLGAGELDGIGYDVIMTHLDSVLSLPPGARPLAETDGEPYAAIRFAESCWGVQFHPEMDAEIIGYYVEARRETLVAEGRDPEAIVRRLRDTANGARVLQRFVGEVGRLGGARGLRMS
jgi:GMP synthase (glutamine-hydrolysing)